MGTVTRVITGHGYTQAEAEKNAFAEDRDGYGHQDGYGGGYDSLREITRVKQISKPVVPKGVHVEQKNVGKPVWKRRWVVELNWKEQDRGHAEYVYKLFEKKAEAMKWAKWKSVEAKVMLDVSNKYVAVEGSPSVTEIRPKAGQQGQWAFECDFRD